MKKIAAILCLSALTTGAFAQGLVTFANSPTTLISIGTASSSTAIGVNSAPAGSFYFGLLIAAAGTTDPTKFNFSGAYGTNISTAAGGRFSGGANITINGWAAGASMAYEVAGWDKSLGVTFNSAWLTSKPGGFGLSGIGTGTAGGGVPPAPAFPLFGGTGLASGFLLSPVTIPEPTSMALAGLGAAALLIFRRRK
jgi:hypothetical protein